LLQIHALKHRNKNHNWTWACAINAPMLRRHATQKVMQIRRWWLTGKQVIKQPLITACSELRKVLV